MKLSTVCLLAAAWPGVAQAQSLNLRPTYDPTAAAALQSATAAPPDYQPIDDAQRLHWIVDGVVGPRSLGVGVLASTWSTGFNTPSEWHRSWSGFGKRYLEREADVALSNSIEGGLGAIWGEDPRYLPSKRKGIWPRVRFAVKTVVLAPRPDGHLAPAWGRFAGNVVNNIIENAWLPPSVTTPGQTVVRSVDGLVGRLLGNLWDEFWPDVRNRLKR
jgi:hypothetical protein